MYRFSTYHLAVWRKMVLIHEDEEGGPFGGPGSFWVYASDHPTSGLAFRKLGMVVSEVMGYIAHYLQCCILSSEV